MTPLDAPSGELVFVDCNDPSREQIAPYTARYWNEYVDYGRTASTRGMAINAMTGGLFLWACEQVNAKAICDLGSGFTSFLAARYALAHPGCVVASVDDEPEWLERTRRFLARHMIPTSGLMSWDAWVASDQMFDVIIHDFNCGEVRNDTMWTASDRLNPGGILIFDDAQHAGHHREAKAVCEAHGWEFRPLFATTTDETRRFAAIAVTA